jgi:hypothetical protein
MSTGPHRFILQALDPDHGSPVLETLFLVTELEDLRALLELDAGDDPEIEGRYTLDAAELAAITERFGIAFDPEGREVALCSWHSVKAQPYFCARFTASAIWSCRKVTKSMPWALSDFG